MGVFTNYEGLYNYCEELPLDPQFSGLSDIANEQFFSSLWSLQPPQVYTVANYLDQPISEVPVYENYLDQVYGLRLGAVLEQIYFDAPVKQTYLDQPYRDAAQLQKSLVQRWGDAQQLTGYLEQPYSIPFFIEQSLQQRWAITDVSLQAMLNQQYDLSQYNFLQTALHQPFVIAPSESLNITPVITVFLGTLQIHSAIHINIEGSRDEYLMSCELAITEQEEYLSFHQQSLDSNDFEDKDDLVITVDGNEFIFKVTPKPSRNRSAPGIESYSVKGSSPAILLDRPFSIPILEQLEPGMASSICEDLSLIKGIDFSWDINDFYIPANILYANNETPIEIIRKIVAAPGAILQSDPDGSLHVRKFYPFSVPQWLSEAPKFHLTDSDNFFTLSEESETRLGYNKFTISDQLNSTTGLVYKEKQISDYVKEVHVFQTPWDGVERPFENSGGTWVLSEPLGVISELIENEEVEIVAGTGKTQNPIYDLSHPPIYKQRQLGTITFGEDGTITTEVDGQSLVNLTYITKYWSYKVTDTQKDRVQCYAIETETGKALGTIILDFADTNAGNAFIVLELDDELNKDSAGEVKTSFYPGDNVYFRIHHDDTVRIKSSAQSSGTVVSFGSVRRTSTQQMSFPTLNDEPETSHIPISISPVWYGRVPILSIDGRKLKANNVPAIGEITHDFYAWSYRITPPPLVLSGDEKYYILTVITLESI
jgi:hypothetical protein